MAAEMNSGGCFFGASPPIRVAGKPAAAEPGSDQSRETNKMAESSSGKIVAN
jgi:hypothetical protein